MDRENREETGIDANRDKEETEIDVNRQRQRKDWDTRVHTQKDEQINGNRLIPGINIDK